MRRKIATVLAAVAAGLWPLLAILRGILRYGPDLIGLPGMVADARVWRDQWIPWLIRAIDSLVYNPAIWLLSFTGVGVLVILSWPEIRTAFHGSKSQVANRQSASTHGIAVDANSTDATFINKLKTHTTDDANVAIGFMIASYKPLAMRLLSLFELAGWPAILSPPCPLEDVRHEYLDAVQVIGRNLLLTEHVANSLRDYGFRNVSISMLPLASREGNPDWLVRKRQQHINIKIGYH